MFLSGGVPVYTGCKGTLKSMKTGTIINYPPTGVYGNNQVCQWTISLTIPIKVKFVGFSLGEICRDYVEIVEFGTKLTLYRRTFCGNNIPVDVHMRNGSFYVRFFSDGLDVNYGLKILIARDG